MSKTNKKPVTVDKPGLTLLALQRPERLAAIVEKPVKDEVIFLPTTEEPVSDDAASSLPVSSKPSSEVANNTEPNDDPLIGTQIEVTPPWGGKTLVNIVDSYMAPSGVKWVSFIPIEECPSGWTWEGGVKKLSTLSL
jgi:hypothetical protein